MASTKPTPPKSGKRLSLKLNNVHTHPKPSENIPAPTPQTAEPQDQIHTTTPTKRQYPESTAKEYKSGKEHENPYAHTFSEESFNSDDADDENSPELQLLREESLHQAYQPPLSPPPTSHQYANLAPDPAPTRPEGMSESAYKAGLEEMQREKEVLREMLRRRDLLEYRVKGQDAVIQRGMERLGWWRADGRPVPRPRKLGVIRRQVVDKSVLGVGVGVGNGRVGKGDGGDVDMDVDGGVEKGEVGGRK